MWKVSCWLQCTFFGSAPKTIDISLETKPLSPSCASGTNIQASASTSIHEYTINYVIGFSSLVDNNLYFFFLKKTPLICLKCLKSSIYFPNSLWIHIFSFINDHFLTTEHFYQQEVEGNDLCNGQYEKVHLVEWWNNGTGYPHSGSNVFNYVVR